MAKINILFDNKDYLIDESSFSDVSASIRTHLSTVMNGSGATINFGETSYNVDSTKLLNATNDFITHLGTISGSGYNVVVDGIEYSISPDKIQNAISELHTSFDSLTLQNIYTFNYYSTLELAAQDVSAETIGDNADSDKENAVAGVYTDGDGKVTIMVLKGTDIEETVVLSGDVTIDFGGYTLTSSAPTAFSLSGNVVVDATRGGGIAMTGETGVKLCALHFTSGTGVINGGKYVTNSSNVATTKADIGTIVIDSGADVTANNVTTIATDDVAAAVSAFLINEGGKGTANNCYIEGTCKSGYNVTGVANYGEFVATNTKIYAYSDYLGNEAGDDYGKFSRGVYSYGSVTLNNCYVYGNHCGVGIINAPLIINGGTYEGYGHGGIYVNSADSGINYICNAEIIGLLDMPVGYEADEVVGNNEAGIYIGSTGTTVYMDNCDIYGKMQPIVLRDKNDILYVSNTRTNTDFTKYPVRISSTSKLYLGSGNNFTKNQTSRPSAVVETGEVYIMN